MAVVVLQTTADAILLYGFHRICIHVFDMYFHTSQVGEKSGGRSLCHSRSS